MVQAFSEKEEASIYIEGIFLKMYKIIAQTL